MMKKKYLAVVWMVLLLAGCNSINVAESSKTEGLVQTETLEQMSVRETESEEEAEITEESELREENEEPTVTITMVGDVLLHTRVDESCQLPDGSYDFSPLFANVRDVVQKSDIALVNQEVILGGKELGISGYPAFNAPYEVADALAETGFDVVLHATNHAMDKGKKGIVSCLLNWEEKYPDITVLGIYDSQKSQDTVTVLEENGIKIAILNYTYGLNGIPLPSDMPYAVGLLKEEKVKSDIAQARELADFVVVCPHWGTEYCLQPDAMQEKWTEFFAENGVDLVIGTHPHVIEPVEWVENEATGNRMLVYYSLGNFVNWTSGSGAGVANRMVGGMAEVTVSLNEKGEAYISDYGVEALVTQVENGYGGVSTYFLRDYTEQMAQKNEIVKQDAAFSKEYCRKLCDSVWGNLWK